MSLQSINFLYLLWALLGRSHFRNFPSRTISGEKMNKMYTYFSYAVLIYAEWG